MACTSVVITALLASRCIFATDQDMSSEFTDGAPTDELTGPTLDDMTAEAAVVAHRPSSNRPPATNIQKVARTGKAVDNMLAAAVALAAVNDTVATATPYTSDLEWLLNVYNPHRWNPVRLPAASRLSVQCRDVMKVYLEALRNGSFWAAKSEFF